MQCINDVDNDDGGDGNGHRGEHKTAVVLVIKTTMPTNLTAIKYYPCTCICIHALNWAAWPICISPQHSNAEFARNGHQKRTLICRLQHMRWNWFNIKCILCVCIVQIYGNVHRLDALVCSLSLSRSVCLFVSSYSSPILHLELLTHEMQLNLLLRHITPTAREQIANAAAHCVLRERQSESELCKQN